MKAIYLVLALSIVACNDITSPAKAAPNTIALATVSPDAVTTDKVFNDRSDITFDLTGCNGEPVTVSGDQHTILKLMYGNDGSLRMSTTTDAHVSGVGASTGAKYIGDIKSVDKLAEGNDRINWISSYSMTLNGQGSVDDTIIEYSTKFTLEPDGSVKHQIYNFSWRCK
jgi:hypothetical protein